MKIGIVGIGLIGGSMALDIKKQYPNDTILGFDSNKENCQLAKELGIVEDVVSEDLIAECDVVIVSIPVDQSIKVITDLLDRIALKTLIIDTGSTKFPLCKALEHHPRRKNFLATHPIAGTEFSGPKAAVENLFQGKTNIICEIEKTSFALQEKALELFKTLGMRIRYMDALSHDKHLAYVSHLSHISSFMLGKTVIEKEKSEQDIFDLAGSGFESTVRLAKSSPEMWTPIFSQNKQFVVESLQEYINNLEYFKTLLEQNDYENVFKEMEQTNRIKQILK